MIFPWFWVFGQYFTLLKSGETTYEFYKDWLIDDKVEEDDAVDYTDTDRFSDYTSIPVSIEERERLDEFVLHG